MAIFNSFLLNYQMVSSMNIPLNHKKKSHGKSPEMTICHHFPMGKSTHQWAIYGSPGSSIDPTRSPRPLFACRNAPRRRRRPRCLRILRLRRLPSRSRWCRLRHPPKPLEAAVIHGGSIVDLLGKNGWFHGLKSHDKWWIHGDLPMATLWVWHKIAHWLVDLPGKWSLIVIFHGIL
jgi:hypothetical protein